MLNKLILIWYYLLYPEKYARKIGVTIGKNCLIYTRNWSSEPYLITIGNHVQVTKDVYFHTHGGAHVIRTIDPKFDCFGKIEVDDDAYIGAGAHIMPGVTIGRGALVAAGSIVTKTVPPHTVVGGNPARVICTVDEYYIKNKHLGVGTYGLATNKKRELLLSLSSDKFIKK